MRDERTYIALSKNMKTPQMRKNPPIVPSQLSLPYLLNCAAERGVEIY